MNIRLLIMAAVAALPHLACANGNVYVSRMWHNHQPVYWPEWNGNGSQTSRMQYAWDSIWLKENADQTYGTGVQHPDNNLRDIFGLDDRRNAYQGRPRDSLATFDSSGGFALSYSGSLIDNVRNLGGNGQLGYGGEWYGGNREARNWWTPAGSRRLDLVGFTYHHSLSPLLPKSVFRKELQIFKQAWWKAWGGNSDLSDHSKGFFPTEMAYSRHLIDVLVDEGYQWIIVPSHHLSRTCPTYNTKANPEGTYNIYSSPPNKADQLGPSPGDGWWYGEPNPGNAAWNVSPYAYQLHRVKYVNPETGAEKTMIAVPSDDVLSYRYGYANEGVGKIDSFIAPYADPSHPVIVMPASDGDNAWGGGYSSWMEATPQFFNEAASHGYQRSTPQDFVNAHGASAALAHIEDGGWIFPEMDYGSPYFLKWIEPPVANAAIGATNRYPGTQVDLETPGFALKFYSYAPLMAGANWCETAEQVWLAEGGQVRPWVIQAPYDWDGNGFGDRNDVELAWHIYLGGSDSGFNYYGGLGNDDEVKQSLATRRAVDKLRPWMTEARRANDRTPPTVLKPQRFPYNPGGYTFGWFNRIPGVDERFLKEMPSEFYVWTHAYDLSGIPNNGVTLKVRIDLDGTNPLGSNQNETYAGGTEVGPWTAIPMVKRALPKTREALNAAAANSQIDYFITAPEDAVADYYFAKISDAHVSGFRGKLLDYYVEALDSRNNLHKSEIQHVFVEDDGGGTEPSPVVAISPAAPTDAQAITITYDPAGRILANASQVYLHVGRNDWHDVVDPRPAMTPVDGKWQYTLAAWPGTTTLDLCFTDNTLWDNNGGQDWHFTVTPAGGGSAPDTPTGLTATASGPNRIDLAWTGVSGATSYVVCEGGTVIGNPTAPAFPHTGLLPDTPYTYTVAARNAYGDSLPSGPVSATTDEQVPPPPAPGGLAASASSQTTVLVSWDAAAGAEDYIVFRNGEGIGGTTGLNWTDTGLVANTKYSYTVAARNAGGTSAASTPVEVTTPASPPPGPEPVPFVMDGIADFPGYLLSNPGMTIHAALRGNLLYVATWAPGEFGNDHFILVGDSALAAATTPAPWAKAGTTAIPTAAPFLGAESSNDYIGWFNTNGASTQTARAAGQQMEGVINVAEAFGTAPANLYLAALAYQTADGGILGSQAPAMVLDNGNVDPSELLVVPLAALRDEDADGTYDRLQTPSSTNAAGQFRILSITRDAAGAITLRWVAFPGRSYRVESSATMAPGSWTDVAGADTTAGAMDLEAAAVLPAVDPPVERLFFRVKLVE